MSERLPLFRGEARHPSAISAQGEIVLIRPPSFTFMVALAVIVATIIVGLLVWGTYTKRSTLTGQLVPDLGLIKVYTPQFGTIIEKHAIEGQSVKQGDVLYVISSELRSSALGNTQALISQQVEMRRQSFRDQIERTKLLEQSERESAQVKLVNLQAELVKVKEQIKSSRERVTLAEDAQTRYDNLSKQGYLTKDQLLQRQTDLLDQRGRLQSLEREQLSLKRQTDDQQTLLNQLSERYQTQIADIERSIASTEQELMQSEVRRRLVITAPETGIATAVVGEVGQTVDSSRPLLSVMPHGALLQAHLYAPSRTIGFVKPGDSVHLRYQAYPYQKFGHYRGTVKSVSMTALSSSELGGNNPVSIGVGGEPVYRVTVNLDSQDVIAYGQPRTLQAGMAVDADVLQEKRRLYEWVLEPLLTLTGKLR